MSESAFHVRERMTGCGGDERRHSKARRLGARWRCPSATPWARRRAPRSAQRRSGSAARISVSPTSTASTPRLASRRSCSALAIPDSETTVTPAGIVAQQRARALDVDAEVAQVAVVDPDQLGAERRARAAAPRGRAPRRARRAPARRASRVQRSQLASGQRRHDQQHRIGARDARLVQLVVVDDEVLAQDRQRAGGARRAQVLERAAEVGALGQHRQRARAAALIGARRSRARSAPRAASRPRASGA